MADLLSLTGDVVGLGDSDVEDFNSFSTDTPHVMLQLADGRSLMVLGITRDEARKLGVGFSEPLTLSLSTTALDHFIDDVEAAEGGWQPIETAPRDGTVFLVFDKLNQKPWHYECQWNGAYWYHGFGDAWPDPAPTHWMPIPPAPAAMKGDQP